MTILTMLNQKGGVGKTSTCHHLAGAVAEGGRRVLLVDNDPQASLTQGFFGPVATEAIHGGSTVAAMYRGDAPLPAEVIRPTQFAGIDLIPGSQAATEYNVPLPDRAPWEAQTCLRDLLAELRGDYDLVLIDCPPNLHLCSWAALVASDFLVVPLQAEDYGSQGLKPVRESLAAARRVNPALGLLGYLLTMFNPRVSIHQTFAESLRSQYGDRVFATAVPYATDFKEAISHRKPITTYKPKGASAKATRALAVEVFARLDAATTRGAA